MPNCDQMSDTDFERYLGMVCDGWARKLDTVDMAEEMGIPECDAYSILICMREADYEHRVADVEPEQHGLQEEVK